MRKITKKVGALVTVCAMCLSTVSYAAALPQTQADEITNSAATLANEATSPNLALKATAASSANETSNFTQEKANDGNMDTRWSSGSVENNPQWLRLDFGEPTTFNCVRLFWEKSGGKAYKVQVSDDGNEWRGVANVTDGQPEEARTLTFDEVTARYVRVYVTENFPDIWTCVSIYEMEVYNNTWDFVFGQAKTQLENAQKWDALSRDVSLVESTDYGATVTWKSDSPYLTVEYGMLKVTLPETTTQATLTATVSYLGNSADVEIPVTILSQTDLDNTYDLNPTPQKLEMQYNLIDFDNVKVYYESGITDVTRGRVQEIMDKQGVSYTVTENYEESTLALGLHGSTENVDTNTTGYSDDLFVASETKYDAHFVDINSNGRVTILGEDDDAVYYGLATLDDAMETVAGQQLTCATIEDYANMQYRGIVEGFYGKVYSVEDILSLFEYMEDNKMNTFVYGPKGDPYHLGNWRDEYPTEITDEQRFYGMMTQDDMRTITAAAAENNISFAWSIHPAMQNGINFTNRDSVEQGIDDIMEKFSHMYDLGVRQFGVFVDDIDTGVALRGSENQAYMMAELQRRLEDKYNGSENPADHVAGTYYVPSFYALGFGSASQLETNLGAFREANQGNNVIMMMTGSGVWSPIRNSDLLKIQQYTGKKPVMWWNYPVNDNIDDQLLMNRIDSVYATDLDVTASLGVLSNPMNQAEASKVALYGVADYTWNTANFDVQSNWEESFASYTDDPAMQEALRVFASHAAKNQDHTNINSIFNAYKSDSSNYPAVLEEMQKIVDSCQLILTLKDSDDYKLVNLEEEIRPWVYRLNDMSQIIIDCIQAMYGEESQRFDHLMNAIYLSNGIDTLEKYKVESLEGQGTSQTISNYVTSPGNLYILPFARYIMTQAGGSFFTDASDPFVYTDTNTEGWAMAKSGNTFTVTDGETVTLASGSYVQFDLAQLVALSSVSGLDDLNVQISLDGKTWTGFAAGTQARYVRVMNNTAQEVTVDLTQVSVTVQQVSIASVTSSAQIYEPNNYPTSNINDYNNTTFVWLNSQQPGTSLTVTYSAPTSINRIEYTTTTDGDRMVGKVNLEYQDTDGNWNSVGIVDSDDFVSGAIAVTFDTVQAKAIRATVTESRSTNWLKIAEFHGVSTDAEYVATVNGVGEAKLTDRDVMSFIQMTGEGEVVYNVYESAKANALVLYNALDSWDGVSVYAVTADGETLLEYAPDASTSGSRVYPANQLKGVTAFRIAYTDGIYLNEIEIKGDRFVALNTYGVQPQVDEAKAAAAEPGYTAESIAALNDAIAAVEAILADNTLGEPVTQEALNTAVEAMNAAVEARVPDQPGQEANKALLQATYDYAVTLDTTGVVDSAVAIFQKALDEAKTVLDDPNATQEQVNTAWDNLLTGIWSLGLKQGDNTAWDNLLTGIWSLGLKQGDKTMLEVLIVKAESMVANESKYMPDHWQELLDALNAGQKVMDDGDALQGDVETAVEALMNAILAQRYKADKSILEDLIGKAESIDLTGYTAESVAMFRSALASAQFVLADETLSEDDQATVDNAVAALSAAMDGLTAGGAPETTDKPEASEKPETTDKPQATEKPENVPQTGDEAMIQIWVALALVSTAALALAVTKKKHNV